MSTTFNNLVIYNGYPLSIVGSVIFHLLLLATLIYLQSGTRVDSLELIQPTIIKALFIDENPQVRNQQIQERQRLERIEDQRIAREREQRQAEEDAAAEAERIRQEQERQRLAEEQQRAALVEREELERQRALDEQRVRELQERDRQQRERELEQQRQRELAERRREEEATAAAAEAARTEFELVQSATALIQQALQQVWNRPPSARNGMQAILRIRMLPTGELLDALITQSSGDPAFDRSAENAVFSAAPFTELQSLPINVFNENFRSLSLIFEPEDLLN
ncbi:MAG: cell envelope integrity protein TolA [Gammaproteobacteria bacterium]|jgi:colicin import membrane protein|nr:cell envelope integrity protein TolA [Gammaproteobacteria bacterium]MDP6732002.1 cell envelope integrity protein TolA [Gammaproteobacteria bacterium]